MAAEGSLAAHADLRAVILRLVQVQREHLATGCHDPECLVAMSEQLEVIAPGAPMLLLELPGNPKRLLELPGNPKRLFALPGNPKRLFALLTEAERMLAADPGEGESTIERVGEVLTDHYDRWPATAVTDPHQGAAYALLAAGLLASDRDGG